MRNNKSSGKGYYIALILCAAAIGITSYVTRGNNKQQEPETISLMETEPAETEAVEALATEPTQAASTPAPTQPTAAPAQPKALKTAPPLPGQVVEVYSMDALSYNETTRDWRVHAGIDYPGEEGDPVAAAADGTVVSVEEDALLGVTVVLRHTGGYETRYSGLQQEVRVKEGESVVLGQTLGNVGTTALTETALGPHLHFSVRYQDMPMDPEDFLALG